MTHVSRNPIEKDVYFHIVDALIWLFSDLKSPTQMKQFLGDFFTKTERLMFAKRLALAGMIIEGYNDEVIHKVLKVSSATIYRMREKLDSGNDALKKAIGRVIQKENLQEFLEGLFKRSGDSAFHPLRDSL